MSQQLDLRTFLCDQMLTRLGRWLRAAGYDTAMTEYPITDRSLFNLAQQEGRLLISRDRHFLEIDKDQQKIIWLQANGIDSCARELTSRIHLNWLNNPFSRCLLCNHSLALDVDKADKIHFFIPEDILTHNLLIRYCLYCQKAYWEGSHSKRMLATLQKWQSYHNL